MAEKCQGRLLGKELKLCGLPFLTRCVPQIKIGIRIPAPNFRGTVNAESCYGLSQPGFS